MTAQMGQKLIPDNGLGLYLHVPFCAKECEFCAFYKERADRKKIDDYLDAVEAELKTWPQGKVASTIFFGGGTPTLLNVEDLDRLCGAVKKTAGDQFVEWSIECAPNTLSPQKLDAMKKHGVNRFSLGVQSFSERALEAIGRPHTVKQTQEAVELLKNNVENWNIDLIFAAADSTMDEWASDLEKALVYAPKHISTYCLTFESDTALFLKMLKGSKKRPSAQEEARFYLKTWEILRGAGMHHYELANFAQTGWECQHNWRTWQMNEWLGIGPSAASQLGLHRFSNVADLGQWAAGIKVGKPALVEEEHLTTAQMGVDALVFGLRLVDGVDVGKIQKRWCDFDATKLRELEKALVDEGLLKTNGTHWKLTDDGLLVADRVGGEILERL